MLFDISFGHTIWYTIPPHNFRYTFHLSIFLAFSVGHFPDDQHGRPQAANRRRYGFHSIYFELFLGIFGRSLKWLPAMASHQQWCEVVYEIVWRESLRRETGKRPDERPGERPGEKATSLALASPVVHWYWPPSGHFWTTWNCSLSLSLSGQSEGANWTLFGGHSDTLLEGGNFKIEHFKLYRFYLKVLKSSAIRVC